MKTHLLSSAALRALAAPAVTAAALIAPVALHAQETTSTIQGSVTRGGVAQAGVAVVVVNVPSGTRSTATTDASGSFTLSGLRVGGPYTVEAGGTQVTDISLTAGQAFSLPIELPPVETAQDIVVTATRIVSARTISQGPANVLTAAQIAQVASINRDIRDLARRDPFATLDTSGNTTRSVSFAGQNPKFNRFTIDGVPITDGFGLNPDGLPSRRGPVPLDAIEQFQTKVAPYDVRDGFFQGGVVNAVLKSGTNQFHGTGFYSYSSDGLTSQRTAPYILNPTGVVLQPKFKSYDFGAQISGPIIPDKLFFMVAAERVRANRPLPTGTTETNGGSPTTGLSDATVAQIVSIAQTKYGYNAGGVLRGDNDRDDRLVARLDANLSDGQRASATYIYTKDSQNVLPNGSTTTLGLSSNAYVKPNEVQAGILQLNSQWSSNFSTEARALYKSYKSGQFPLLGNIAQVNVCTAPTSDRPAVPNGTTTATTLAGACITGTPQVVIGAQTTAQANILKTETYGGSLQARLTLNDHSVRVLADYQAVTVFNLFVPTVKGSFYFDSIADFAAGNAQRFGYGNAVPSLDVNDGAARFGYQTYTFGIQDDWRVNDMLSVSYGARYDLFGGRSKPVLNNAFLGRYGFANTAFINGRGLFQPRFGFDFRPTQRLSIRGGGGIFGAGTPDVYVSNSFQNSGVLTNSLTAQITDGGIYQINGALAPAGVGPALLNNVDIKTVPATANTQLAGGTLAATTSTASLDPNFRIPSQFRATLSADYKANLGPLGDGWRFGVDFFYSKVRDQVLFVDLRSVPVAGSFTPDGRQRYRGLISAGDANNDIQLTTTKLGRSYIGVVRFDKTFDFGLNIFGSYSLQDVKDQAPATSSVAASNYSNGPYSDPNRVAYGTANEQVRWAFKYGVGFDRQFFGEYHTRFNLFGETRAGSPFSYGFRDNTAQRSTVFGTTGTNTRYLFYVPTGTTDPLVTYADLTPGGTSVTRDRVEAIINGSGLAGWRGKIAPRNVFRSKAFTKIDLHAEQELPLPFGGRFTLFGDIENFTNLLNKNWGQQLRASFSYTKTVADVACVASPIGVTPANPCAQYSYSNARSDALLSDTLATSSLFAIRIGARISF